MKKNRFTEEQIVKILRESDQGKTYQELGREYGVHPVTIGNPKRRYGGMESSDLQKMKILEEENRRLRQIVADLTLDKRILQEVNAKKW